MRTVAADLLAALQVQSPQTTAIVSITLADRTLSFTTGDKRRFGYAPSVVSISPVSTKFDTVKKSATISGCNIVFRPDGAIRQMFTGDYMRNKYVEVKLGAEGVDEADYLTIWAGKITDVVPGKTGFVVAADSIADLLENVETSAVYRGNTLEVLYDLITDTDAAGVDASYVDAASFDPANYTSSISHYQTITNYTHSPWNNATTHPLTHNATNGVHDLIDEITAGLPGFVYQGTDGLLKFKLLDIAGSVSRHIAKRDLIDFEIESTLENVVNEVTVQFFRDDETGDLKASFTAADATAQIASALPSSAATADSIDPIELKWFRGQKALRTTLTSIATDVVLAGAASQGSIDLFTGESSDTDQQPSASRPVYLKIDDEIIKATGITLGPATFEWHHLVDGAIVVETVYDTITFTGCTRAQFGTTAAAHTRGTIATDYTQAIRTAQDIIAQRAYGQPRASVTLPLHQIEIEELDLITLDHDVYAFYGVDGADSSTVWRVVEISIVPWGRKSGLDVTLEWVRDSESAAVSSAMVDARSDAEPLMRPIREMSSRQLVIDAWTIDGLGLTDNGGRNATLALGEIGTYAGPRKITAAITRDFDANSDSYIYADIINGGVAIVATTVGGTPSEPDGFVRLHRIRTDATDIVSTVDYRKTKPLDGDKLQSGSVPGTALEDGIDGDALEFTSGVLDVKVDGVTIGINAFNELEALSSGGITGTLTSPRVPHASGASTLTDTAGFEFTSGRLNIPSALVVGDGATALAPTTGYAIDLHPTTGGLRVAPPARSASAHNLVRFVAPSETSAALTASTNTPAYYFGAGTTQFATGAKALQYHVEFAQPTWSTPGASTLSDGATLFVPLPASAGSLTITRQHQLITDAATISFWTTSTPTRIIIGKISGNYPGTESYLFGNNSCSPNAGQVAFGAFTTSGSNCVGIGVNANGLASWAIGIGFANTSRSSDSVYWGGTSFSSGFTNSVTQFTQHVIAPNGTSNTAGIHHAIAGGKNTGSGTPGSVLIQTGTVGAPGTTLSGLTTRATFSATELTLTYPAWLPDGAVGAPALSFSGDTNTGIYRIGADNIGVAANGAKVLDISTTGLSITGTLDVSGKAAFAARAQTKKGADVASANDLALGSDGNVFAITGTTQINGIATANWQAGSVVILIFASTPTVKHNTAASAGYAKLKLAGSADLTAAAETVLQLVYDGTDWQEVSRKAA